MNKQMYKLVFSKRLGMLVPASEAARSNTCKSSGSRIRSHRRLLAVLLAVLLASFVQMAAAAPGGLVPHSTRPWTNAFIDAARTNATQMTITQTNAKAYLNWQQLNLAKGETLTFDQQGNKNWAALNRIYDQSPSVIAGQVKADGHIYFINANGIIFGEGAQVNVGSLTASSLDVTDALFEAGILSNPSSFVFSGTTGFVRVDQGANITTSTGGRVMLLAPDVTNSGVINTPDGQTILAAGKQVYLMDSEDPAGLLVEVNSGGTATNLGEIVAQRGNVTLVGLAVNQQGRISASTSVRANGSIHLLARDTVALENGTNKPLATRGGVLTVGEGSQTNVEVETSDKEEVLDAQTLNPSRVLMSGGVISIDGSIIAHGGEVMATAAFNPTLPTSDATASSVVDVARIYLGENALIDVSGVDALAPMSRHQLEIQLFSEQLKDTPILRDGPLFGETIFVDARKGTALTDIDPYLALKGKTIAERMSAGGTVTLDAIRGDVLTENGAVVDVSGGSVTYEAGYVKESSLYYNGKTIAVSAADSNTPYQGVTDSFSVTNEKWNVTRNWKLNGGKGTYYKQYTDGSNAGTVNVTASHAVLDAEFKAETGASFMQRTNLPQGGAFNLTIPAGLGGVPTTLSMVDRLSETLAGGFAPVGEFNEATQKFESGDDLTQTLNEKTEVEASLFDNGFTSVSLKSQSGGAISVDTAIDASPESSLTLSTLGNVSINRDITIAGGNVDVSGGSIAVADGVTISTAGMYTNDTPGISDTPDAPIAIDGGDIQLSAVGTTTLGQGSVIDASAGAWMTADGELKGGDGGDITLNGVETIANGQVRSYGFGKGGKLAISTLLNSKIGGVNPGRADTFWLSERFFTQGGFSGYSITNSLTDKTMTVGDDTRTVIQPLMQTLVANRGAGLLKSGTDMANVAHAELLPEEQRTPASIALTSNGALTVTENTEIRTDAPRSSDVQGGAISLSSIGQMTILGDLIAPSGSISAAMTGAMERYGYDNTLSLYVGENATLSATGVYALAAPDGSGLLKGEVLDGGTISLDGGDRAVVIAKAGSLLDVSGVSGTLDVAGERGHTRETQHGAAGTISVSARNGMALDGNLRAAAPGSGKDGTLVLTVRGGDDTSSKAHPNGERVLQVTQQNMLRANGLAAGDVLDTLTGTGAISAEQVETGGFGSLSLEVDRGITGDRVVLSSGLDMKVTDSIAMNASELEVAGSGTAKIAASYVKLNGTSEATATAGDAALKIDADFIDLVGNVAVSGVNSTTLSSSYDIRGRGTKAGSDDLFSGSLKTPGELILSARQINPVTNGRFMFEATGAGSRIEVKSSGKAPGTLLSAGGVLTLKADDIVQGGVLRAPLGEINLEAANSLTLKNGSLTSVSLNGDLVPYGLTRLGGLDVLAPNEDLQASDNGTALTAMPEKKLNLEAANVTLEDGATLDISGGGDTFAYEWIEGIGGSKDILTQDGVYAVLPSLKNDYAPFDFNYQIGSDLKMGDAVYLSGVPGLTDGMYTLLPARYALVPGAYMVQTTSAGLAKGASAVQLDGSTLVSGYRTTLNGSSRDAAYSTFRITNGNVFRPAEGDVSKVASEYRITNGNAFFTAQAAESGVQPARLASDAGQLVLNAADSLTLGADLLTGKAADARGALVDIVSNKISVVSEIGADDGTGTLQLAASSLNDLGAESLLLGGSRTQGEDGVTISAGASEVTFANDAEHAVTVGELIAVASDSLIVNEGASIQTGEAAQSTGTETLLASGDGALLAVSSLNDLEFSRSGVTGATGTLEINSGATVQAGRSIVLDSTKTASLDGDVEVGDGGSATLGANRVLLGNPAAAVDGLRVDNVLLADLGNLTKVTLNSAQNLEIHGSVALGNENLDLTFNSSGVKGVLGSDESADLTARTFTLKNSTGVSSVAAAGNGMLNVNANTIVVQGSDPDAGSSSSIGVGGFSTVNLAANGEVRLEGVGETRINADTVNISSARISGATGADYAVKASGALTAAMAENAATLSVAQGLGAKLALQGSSLTLAGKVELPSGQFTAQATSGDLTLADGADIQVGSVPVSFDKYVEYTPGGTVILQADAGDVNVDSGATVNVDGAGDADAGMLKISAKSGTATVNGTLSGNRGSEDGDSGSFELDAGTLADFGLLNDKLNDGGFAKSRQMRIRNGDVTVAADDTVQAENIILSADAGSLTVAGTLDASAAKDSMIGLYGGNGVTLSGSANLNAASSEDGAAGGTVEVATSNGYLDLQSGSSINVSGGGGGEGGEVKLRAPRTADNKDIQITAVASAIDGASSIRAEGFKSYTDSSISTTDFATTGTWYKEAESFLKSALASSGVGMSRLGKSGDALFTIVPGLEIRNVSGDIALVNDWSLYDWRFDPDTGVGVTNPAQLENGQDADGHKLLAGVLTLRASGNLDFSKAEAALNDGFSDSTASGVVQKGGQSWSYNLVAGADFSAANPMSVIKGDVSINMGPSNVGDSTRTTANYSNGSLKVVATLSGYTLQSNTVVGFSLTSIPSAGSPTSPVVLNVSGKGEKKLFKLDGSVVTKEGLKASVNYLAKYNVSKSQYELVPVGTIRTGTGDIHIASGGDLNLGSTATVLYTAGHSAEDVAGFTNPSDSLYLTNGGDIDIDVKGDIIGKIDTSGAQQLITHWLFRQGGGSSDKQVSWWVRPDLFKQGVATFGGGDVNIRASGDITNFSASAATTARYVDADNYIVNGGGDVTVEAGADINSGIYFASKGNIRIDAGGAVQSSDNTFGTTIALMNASAEVSAVKSATIETVFNPTMWAQATSNASTFDQTGNNAYFLTYGEDSAFELSSLTGNAGLGLSSSEKLTKDLVTGINSTAIAKDALEIYPGTVTTTAFSGDINMGRLVMSPSETGDLSLLAAGDISGSLVAMSDADIAQLPDVTSPVSQSSGLETAINQFRFVEKDNENVVSHASTPVHTGDDKPVVIVAKNGSISLTGVSTSDKYAGAGLLSPKAVYLHAGKDITLDADIQHLSSRDISVIRAGRNFTLPTDPGSIVQLSGPGELLLQAGRDVNLGSSQGIVTVADTVNTALPDEGASITVLAGLGKQGGDVNAYIDQFIAPSGAGPATLEADAGALADFIETSSDVEKVQEAQKLLDEKVLGYKQGTANALTLYVRKVTGDESLTAEQAFETFQTLDEGHRAVFAYRHLSSELLASGETSGFINNIARGDSAVAKLFPAGREYDGNISLFNSQIRTLRDGGIDLLAPGGLVNAGVPTSSGTDIGIVTEFGGDIRAFAETGFQVEQSKVITQYGSDITIWVNNGDIDAGRGSKSAVSVPERVVSTDADGNTTILVKGVAAGSGIRGQTYDPDGPAGPQLAPELGDVTLIAPRGKLNLGEAGIGGGKIKIIAPEVTGPGGIDGTSVSGAPATDTSSLAATAGIANVGSEATNSATDGVERQMAQATPENFMPKNFMPAFVSVEVIGLGD